MADELVYTSVARGLKPGSRGFCVVASTAGLSPRTVAVLESLSAYRHLHTPTGEPHPGNPVAWSHFHLPGEGQSILSRIADAGLDYSGRTNKLAHHIVIDHGERSSNGPAAMLKASNLMTTWTGDPGILPERVLGSGQPVTGMASTWQSVAGDAGWAGELARSGFHQPRTIVVPVGVDALALVGEALSLMPPQERWRIGFTTFDNGLPQGMTCHWRFVVAGTPEHQQVQKSGPAGLIDLTSSLGRAPDSPQATMARTGDRSTLPSGAQPASAPLTPTAKAKQTGSASPVSDKVAAFQAKTAAGLDEYTLGPPPAGVPPIPSLPGTRLPAAQDSKPLPPPDLSPEPRGKGIAFWLVLAAIAGCLMLVIVGGAAWMLMPSLAGRTPAKAMSLDEMMEDKPDLPDEMIAEPVEEVVNESTEMSVTANDVEASTEPESSDDSEYAEDLVSDAENDFEVSGNAQPIVTMPEAEPTPTVNPPLEDVEKTFELELAGFEQWKLPDSEIIQNADVYSIDGQASDSILRFAHVETLQIEGQNLQRRPSESGVQATGLVPASGPTTSYQINSNRQIREIELTNKQQFLLTKLNSNHSVFFVPTMEPQTIEIVVDSKPTSWVNDEDFTSLGSVSKTLKDVVLCSGEIETRLVWDDNKGPKNWALKDNRLEWNWKEVNKNLPQISLDLEVVIDTNLKPGSKDLHVGAKFAGKFGLEGQVLTKRFEKAKMKALGKAKNDHGGKSFVLKVLTKHEPVEVVLKRGDKLVKCRLVARQERILTTFKLEIPSRIVGWTVKPPKQSEPQDGV